MQKAKQQTQPELSFKEMIIKKFIKVPIVAGYCVVMHMLR
jgi:hypothetical protein